MYNGTAVIATGAGAATLPYTGMNIVWVLLAGFSMIAVGFAIRRMLPRNEA